MRCAFLFVVRVDTALGPQYASPMTHGRHRRPKSNRFVGLVVFAVLYALVTLVTGVVVLWATAGVDMVDGPSRVIAGFVVCPPFVFGWLFSALDKGKV